MSMNDTPSSERVHIAFFGCRNAGKSSVVNAFTGQSLSIVSDTKGTTTDPVKKSMELLPLGPVVIIDTPGIDDEGELGEKRIEKAVNILYQTDIAVLVADASLGLLSADRTLISEFEKRKLPYVIVYNKSDLLREGEAENLSKTESEQTQTHICVSALRGDGINDLKNLIAGFAKKLPQSGLLVEDLVTAGDRLILVIPIDKAAPKGRLILPQQQVIRSALDVGAIPVLCRESELTETLGALKTPPRLVVTDSQVFGPVSAAIPETIPLTSFSILMARYKGNLKPSVEGAKVLDEIRTGDKVLIAEGCTHHRQCEDIGTVKLPAWIKKHTGAEPDFHFTSGTEFPADLSDYKLIIHCGACMLNPAEAQSRYKCAKEQGIPITNYGIAIAHMKGILKRSLSPFEN